MARPFAGPKGAAAVVLAAGRSTRMGDANKLLLEIEPGVPVIRRTVERAPQSGLDCVLVVTGHDADAVKAALAGLSCRFVHNPDFADGLSGSIRAGFRAAVDGGASGVLVMLGDMPFLPEQAIAAVLSAAAVDPQCAVQAVHAGKPAHPIWLPARLIALADDLRGDRGLRGVIAQRGEAMRDVEVEGAATEDIDTPQDFAAALDKAASRH